MKTNNKGFSLVELIVVIAIMAILAAVAIPTFATFITKAQDAASVQEVADLAYAADLACMEYNVNVTVDLDDETGDVTLTFAGDKANAAAAQVAEVSENAKVSASDAKVVTLEFEKALSADGVAKADEALDRLDKYAPATEPETPAQGGNGENNPSNP